MPLYAVGSQGYQGYQGFQGVQGFSGPQGTQGSQGSQGAAGNGPQGAMGAAGPNGFAGANGAQGATGSQGPTGATGPQGSQGGGGFAGNVGATGDTGAKGIILPVMNADKKEDYVQLLCVESPDVRFEDLIEIKMGNQGEIEHTVVKSIDNYFLQICESETIAPVGIVSSKPIKHCAKIINNKLFVKIKGKHIIDNEINVSVTISGIRKGMLGRRFAKRTYEELLKNNEFWDSWRK